MNRLYYPVSQDMGKLYNHNLNYFTYLYVFPMDRDIQLYSQETMNYLSHLVSQYMTKFFHTHHLNLLTNLFD